MNGPVAIRHMDIREAEPAPPSGVETVLTIFWWDGLPIGSVTLRSAELPIGPGQLRALAAQFVAEQLAARDSDLGAPLRATYEGDPLPKLTVASAEALDGLVERIDGIAAPAPETTSGEDMSVIVCTRDRGEPLAACLAGILAQRSPPGEVVVVDNSGDGSARAVCDRFPGIVYVHEPRPGLSIARNAGIRAATRDIIVFTDDDVEPHPLWIAEMARTFAGFDGDAVTGLVLPAILDTAAQRCFQFEMGAFGSKVVPTLFNAQFLAETRPGGGHVWKVGAGANMAFRRSIFDRIGLFDERLGAGASGCSEDSEYWYRILAAGGTCLYEPRIVVFHHHRDDWPGLKRQMRAYMRGHVSALVAQYDRFRDRGNIARIFKQLPAYFLHTLLDTLLNDRPARRAMLVQEVIGWTQGLQYLFRWRWRRARTERPLP